jgi:branched-chain amino acid aminotransferase
MDVAGCWHNGKIVDAGKAAPSIASMSLHYGLAVFEGMRAYGNGNHFHVVRLARHVNRFLTGSTRLGFAPNWSYDDIVSAVTQVIEPLDRSQTYYIRPIAYRAQQHLWLTGMEDVPVEVAILAAPVARDNYAPLTLQMSPIRRVSSAAIPIAWKTAGSYVNSYLCRRVAEEAGYDDGLMCDADGRLTEVSAANLFLLAGDDLITPAPSDDVFPGITRDLVMGFGRDAGLNVIERTLRESDIKQADAAFVSSTLMELRPVTRIGEIALASDTNVRVRQIISAFRDYTHSAAPGE